MNTVTQERSYELVQMFCFIIDSMKLYTTALDQAKKLTFSRYKLIFGNASLRASSNWKQLLLM